MNSFIHLLSIDFIKCGTLQYLHNSGVGGLDACAEIESVDAQEFNHRVLFQY